MKLENVDFEKLFYDLENADEWHSYPNFNPDLYVNVNEILVKHILKSIIKKHVDEDVDKIVVILKSIDKERMDSIIQKLDFIAYKMLRRATRTKISECDDYLNQSKWTMLK